MSVQLVGVLNVTPDSFSDGGQFIDPAMALAQAERLFADGASIVDVGGEATNPWAKPIDAIEEWRRIGDILQGLLAQHSGAISIDTRHPETVECAAAYGDFIVNDVTGFSNPEMIAVTAKHNLRAIISHLPAAARGDIQQAHTEMKLTDVNQVRDELLTQKAALIAAGIPAEHIILDPGIGFGKSMPLNWELLAFAKLVPGERVMIGHSRKRFLATDPQTGQDIPGADKTDHTLNIQAALTAIRSGATYLRVHDPTLLSGHLTD